MNGLKKFARNYKTIFLLLALCIAMSFISPFFLTKFNMSNIMAQVAIYGIISVGMTFAVVAGEFDLSVGALMALSTVIVAKLSPIISVPAAILVALVAGFLVGYANGLMITKLNMSSFVATLGMMIVLSGLNLVIQPEPLRLQSMAMIKFGNGKIAGIPYAFLIFLLCIFVGQFVLKRTRFGLNLYATGGNKDMAQRAGINVASCKIAVMVITSVSAAVAGVLMVARLGSASAVYGATATNDAISNIVIGGTSLAGGTGGMFNTLIGVLLMGVVTNSTTQLGLNPFMQQALSGAILVLVVAIDAYVASRGKKSK